MRKLTGLISLFAILLTGTTAISATRHSNQNSRPNNTKKLSTGDTTNRTVTARSATPKQTVTARSATTRGATSRAARTATTAQNVTARTNAQPDDASVARAAVTGSTSIIQTDTVQTPLYTGRVSTRGSTSKIRARIPTISVSNTTTAVNAETAEDMTSSMDELAQITDFCKAQYTECMDNFCNVLDDNQGRCSCSKNLESYAKTEAALQAATAELQEVAQKIQYIGLSPDQIETLFTQTEAEATMQSTTDNTQLKNDLDNIRDMIIDVKSANATTNSSGFNIDLSGLLDFTIDSTGFDLSSIFGGTTNTNSISNQRGEQLYKTAVARCKATVLNNCQQQGVDTSLITNSYDLEIDKQCLAYERSLTDANDQMASTVRNAKSVLQKARLLVAQQKNAYDLRGCVSALDSCMQDEFVCGSDYENCLDPTGKYIVNGEVVVGSTPGHTVSENISEETGPDLYPTDGLYATWNYDQNKKNAWASKTTSGNNTLTDNGNLADYIKEHIGSDTAAASSATDMLKMADYLESKIGSHDDSTGRDSGMCMSVLNQCQDYTYSDVGKNKTYIKNNEVIREYMYRTLTKIKTMQDEIIADFAENCIADVSSCLGQNNYPDTPSGATGNAQENIAVNACRAIIASCMSVNGNATKDPKISEMLDWTCSTISGQNCNPTNTNTPTRCTVDELMAIDKNAASGIKSQNKCTIQTCKTGYTLTNNACVAIATPQTETERCLANGDAKISYNKEMCVIYGLTDQNECEQIAQKNNSAVFVFMILNTFPLRIPGKRITDTHCFYVLESAYDKYAQSCIANGGTPNNENCEFTTLDQCSKFVQTCRNNPNASAEDCDSIQNNCTFYVTNTSEHTYDYNMLDNRGVSTLWITPRQNYYGSDLRGECLPGMEPNTTNGNCECKTGYGRLDLMHHGCVPCDAYDWLLGNGEHDYLGIGTVDGGECPQCSAAELEAKNATIGHMVNGKCRLDACKNNSLPNPVTNSCDDTDTTYPACPADKIPANSNESTALLYNDTCYIFECAHGYYSPDGKSCIKIP